MVIFLLGSGSEYLVYVYKYTHELMQCNSELCSLQSLSGVLKNTHSAVNVITYIDHELWLLP
jgi:hypothetical protein